MLLLEGKNVWFLGLHALAAWHEAKMLFSVIFVGNVRFNSPRMMRMWRINTDVYRKRWHPFEKSAAICFIRVIWDEFQPPMRRS